MTTKSKFFLLGIIVAAAVAVGAYFIFRGSPMAYLNALPQDAVALVRFDAKAVLEEADLTQEECSRLFQKLAYSDEENAQIGIDLSRPVYGFAAQKDNFGLLAAVSSEGDLTQWCERLAAKGHASEVLHQRGYSWVVLEQNWLMAFDHHKALVMGPAVGEAQYQLRTVIASLMDQDRENSAMETELYTALNTKDEALVAVLKPEILPDDVQQSLQSLKLAAATEGLYLLTLDTDDNEMELEAELVSEDEAVKKELQSVNDFLRPITGDLAKYAQNNHAAWCAANVQGDKVLKLLRSNPSVRTALIMLNMIVDADRMIQAIDGDVVVELTTAKATPDSDGVNFNFDFQNANLLAQMANSDFLGDASAWGNSLWDVKALSATDFVVNMETPFYFGMKDKVFYLSGTKGLSAGNNDYLREKRSDIKGARFFATINLAVVPLEPLTAWAQKFGDLERLDMTMKQAGELSFKLKAAEGTIISHALLQLLLE